MRPRICRRSVQKHSTRIAKELIQRKTMEPHNHNSNNKKEKSALMFSDCWEK